MATYSFIQLKDSTGNLYPIIDITNFSVGGVKQEGSLATQAWVNSAIAAYAHLTREVVQSLDAVTNPKTTVIYMVPMGTTDEYQNIYEEYLYVEQPDTITSVVFDGKALRDGSLDTTVSGTQYYAWKAATGVFYTTEEIPVEGVTALYTIVDGVVQQEAAGVDTYQEQYENFELLGTTQTDLSSKQDKIQVGPGLSMAADGVTISVKMSGDVLGDSADVLATEKAVKAAIETVTKYTAGDGLLLSDSNEFSLKTADVVSTSIDYTTETAPVVGGVVVGNHLSLSTVQVPDTSEGANEGDMIEVSGVLSVNVANGTTTTGVVSEGDGVTIVDGVLSTVLQYEVIGQAE